MNQIKVQIDSTRPVFYRIYIGQNILDRIGVILNKGDGVKRFVLLTDSKVNRLYGPQVLNTLRRMDLRVDLLEFPEGEASKNLSTVLSLVEGLLSLEADRQTGLIALGGGVTGDLTGFIASIYMRGVPYFQIPTTLMAQVDSSIGGKTGVDLPAGKNLLGTFYQPQAVFTDLNFLQTLEPADYQNGLSEIIKYGIIEDPQILTTLGEERKAVQARDPEILSGLVGKCCRIKKRIVEMDEKEGGLRRLLNFGHTLGHALEAESGFCLPHGQAVAMGMVFAAHLSEKKGFLSPRHRERIESLMVAYGLPARIPKEFQPEGLLRRLTRDKKKQGSVLPFVLIKKIGLPFLSTEVTEKDIRETIEALQS